MPRSAVHRAVSAAFHGGGVHASPAALRVPGGVWRGRGWRRRVTAARLIAVPSASHSQQVKQYRRHGGAAAGNRQSQQAQCRRVMSPPCRPPSMPLRRSRLALAMPQRRDIRRIPAASAPLVRSPPRSAGRPAIRRTSATVWRIAPPAVPSCASVASPVVAPSGSRLAIPSRVRRPRPRQNQSPPAGSTPQTAGFPWRCYFLDMTLKKKDDDMRYLLRRSWMATVKTSRLRRRSPPSRRPPPYRVFYP